MATLERIESTSSQRGGKERFRVIARLVMAMKRFQASLNPTVTFGKRASDPQAQESEALHAAHVRKATAAATGRRTSQDRTASGRTVSGRPSAAGQAHGHKAHLLFRHLPEVEAKAR